MSSSSPTATPFTHAGLSKSKYFKYDVPSLVFGTWYLLLWYLAFDTLVLCYFATLVLGTLVFGIWCLVLGTWYFGIWYLVFGIWHFDTLGLGTFVCGASVLWCLVLLYSVLWYLVLGTLVLDAKIHGILNNSCLVDLAEMRNTKSAP